MVERQQYIGEIVSEGFSDKIVIMGFPYDHGARRANLRAGSNYGPDSFRRFLKMN
jgi:hypothetical protein